MTNKTIQIVETHRQPEENEFFFYQEPLRTAGVKELLEYLETYHGFKIEEIKGSVSTLVKAKIGPNNGNKLKIDDKIYFKKSHQTNKLKKMGFNITSNYSGEHAGQYIAAALKSAKSLDFLTNIGSQLIITDDNYYDVNQDFKYAVANAILTGKPTFAKSDGYDVALYLNLQIVADQTFHNTYFYNIFL